MPVHTGWMNEETMKQLVEEPNAFSLINIESSANEVHQNSRVAASMADIFNHFAFVCPRCTRGAAKLVRLRPLVNALITRLVQDNDIVRAGQVANCAPILGLDLASLDYVDWSKILGEVRTSPHSDSIKRALRGRVYHMISRPNSWLKTQEFIFKLQRTGQFSDQQIAIWRLTAVSAEVSRGTELHKIREGSNTRQWNQDQEYYDNINPNSLVLASLLPVIADACRYDDIPDARDNLDRLKSELDKDWRDSNLGGTERVMATAMTVVAGEDKKYWLTEQRQQIDDLEHVSYVPLMPVADVRRILKAA